MKCPHCGKESKSKVIVSRKHDGQVWRQRICGLCLTEFVSCETTSKDMKFPWGAVMKGRRQVVEIEEKPVQKANRWVFPERLWR